MHRGTDKRQLVFAFVDAESIYDLDTVNDAIQRACFSIDSLVGQHVYIRPQAERQIDELRAYRYNNEHRAIVERRQQVEARIAEQRMWNPRPSRTVRSTGALRGTRITRTTTRGRLRAAAERLRRGRVTGEPEIRVSPTSSLMHPSQVEAYQRLFNEPAVLDHLRQRQREIADQWSRYVENLDLLPLPLLPETPDGD